MFLSTSSMARIWTHRVAAWGGGAAAWIRGVAGWTYGVAASPHRAHRRLRELPHGQRQREGGECLLAARERLYVGGRVRALVLHGNGASLGASHGVSRGAPPWHAAWRVAWCISHGESHGALDGSLGWSLGWSLGVVRAACDEVDTRGVSCSLRWSKWRSPPEGVCQCEACDHDHGGCVSEGGKQCTEVCSSCAPSPL